MAATKKQRIWNRGAIRNTRNHKNRRYSPSHSDIEDAIERYIRGGGSIVPASNNDINANEMDVRSNVKAVHDWLVDNSDMHDFFRKAKGWLDR